MKSLFTIIAFVCITTLSFSQKEPYQLDKIYKIAPNGTILLNSDDADVTITGSNRNDVHVKIFRQVTNSGVSIGKGEFSVDVESSKNTLSIKERELNRSNITFTANYEVEYTIDIEAPYGVSLDIIGDDGDQIISNINGSISMSIDDADTQIKNCGGKKFSFKVDDGDVYMNKAAGSIFAHFDDGDLNITNADLTELDATFDDGKLNVETSLANNGNFKITGDDSSIQLNITSGGGLVEVKHDDSRVSSSNDFEKIIDKDHITQLKLGDGSAKINIRVDDGSVRLETK